MPHALRTSVDDFIEGLRSFEQHLITKDKIAEYVDSMRLSAEALRPFTFFHQDHYTRNLLYKDPLFEVMVICWSPGQKTPIHTHNGSLGWMTVAQGEISIHNFHYLSCNAPQNQNVIGIDCLAGATRIELESKETIECAEGSPVATVDKLQTIHQMENHDPARAGCVTLHVYSPPIESCVAFDLDHQRCFRRSLRYDTQYGKPLPEEPAPSPRLNNLQQPR